MSESPEARARRRAHKLLGLPVADSIHAGEATWTRGKCDRLTAELLRLKAEADELRADLDTSRGDAETYRRERDAALRSNAELRGMLLMDDAWPLVDIVTKLADAARHLMRDHACDAHGWEEVNGAEQRARAWIERMARPDVTAATDTGEPAEVLDENGDPTW